MTEKGTKKQGGTEIDLGVVKFSFGGLFKGIERLVDLAEEVKKAGGEIKKEGELDLGKIKEGMRAVYGFSVKTAVGGGPVLETFGNIRKTSEGPVMEEEREPLTDVFDEKDEVIVIAEIPGVKIEGISIELKDDMMEILAVNKHRKYRKELLLPSKVKKETLTQTYQNGILEVRVKK